MADTNTQQQAAASGIAVSELDGLLKREFKPKSDEAQQAVERAVHFGARQLLGQHRGLWDLLSARAAARVTG